MSLLEGMDVVSRVSDPTAVSSGTWASFRNGVLVAVFVCAVAPVSGADGLDPVATANGQRLEVWELDREVATVISRGSYHQRVSTERVAEIRCESLRGLVLGELKRQWAQDNPVPVDPAAVEVAWQVVRDRFESDAQYRAALEIKGIGEDGLRRAIQRDVVAEAVNESIVSGVQAPTETELEVYFILHSLDYMSPEARHVVHVLVPVAPSSRGEEWQAAEKRARELVSEVTEGEGSLLDVAEHDLERLPPRFRDKVGDIGFVHRGSLQPAVDEAVFAVEPGAVTDPVRTIYGYHVLQVISTRPPQPMELGQVRGAVEDRIIEERRQQELEDLERRLLEASVIEVEECRESL